MLKALNGTLRATNAQLFNKEAFVSERNSVVMIIEPFCNGIIGLLSEIRDGDVCKITENAARTGNYAPDELNFIG